MVVCVLGRLAAEELDIVTCGVSDHRHADVVVDAANTSAPTPTPTPAPTPPHPQSP